jgi:hypothetical protein
MGDVQMARGTTWWTWMEGERDATQLNGRTSHVWLFFFSPLFLGHKLRLPLGIRSATMKPHSDT